MTLTMEWGYFFKVSVVGLKTPAARSKAIIRALDNATRRLGSRPERVMVDTGLMVDIEELDACGLQVVRTNRVRADKETVDLCRGPVAARSVPGAPARVMVQGRLLPEAVRYE